MRNVLTKRKLRHMERDMYLAMTETGRMYVNEKGEVWRRFKTFSEGRCLSQEKRAETWNKQTGYGFVRMPINGVRECVTVGRLVWQHFHGDIPGDLEVNHKDGNKRNNHPSNLELASRSENMIHSYRVLNRAVVRFPSLTDEQALEIKQRRAAGERRIDLAREFGVGSCTIGDICMGRNYKHLSEES